MAKDIEQREKSLESKSDALTEKVETNNGVAQERSKINALLGRFKDEKLATSKTVEAYKNAAEQDPTLKGLQGFYKWIDEQWDKANIDLKNVRMQIDAGIRDGFMSENDREFLMNNLILTDDHDFVGKSEKIKELLDGKMKRIKDDRKEYDELINHPLVKNTGFLKSDANTKIMIPNEKDFLKMEVPERRKLLEQAKKALPEAEKYAEKHGGAESEKLNKEYESLLNAARKEGVIGKATLEKYMDGFKKIDLAEKKDWMQELKNGNQLKRYKELWKNIRKTLKGSDLTRMEELRDQKGYTELFTEFGRLKEQESLKITKDYDEKLEQAYKGKVISKHTKQEFAKDIRNHDLEKKREYLDGFDQQMSRYRTLRTQINQLKDKRGQAMLNSMYETENNGFTEISSAYNRFKSNGLNVLGSGKTDPLADVRDISVKRGIMKANELLKAQGKEKQTAFLTRLKRMISGEQSESFDGSGFQKNLRKMRDDKKVREKSAEGVVRKTEKTDDSAFISMQNNLRNKRIQMNNMERGKDEDQMNIKRGTDKVDKTAVEDELKSAGAENNARILKDENFMQIESVGEGERTQRAALVEINRVKSLEHWDRENQKKEYRGKQYGGKDKVSFSVKTDDGRTVELTLQQIRAMEKLLKADIQGTEEEGKAA